MGLLPEYERLYRTIEDLEFRTRDSTDHPEDRRSGQLEQALRSLRDDMESGKKPRNLEDRMKEALAVLEYARRNENSFMSISEADRYWHIIEDLRLGLRDFPNY